METLAAAIRSNEAIKGIQIGYREHKLNFFADDTVLYVSEPFISTPPLLEIMEDFGNMVGFAVNYSKSEAYPINLSIDSCNTYHSTFKFCLVKKQRRHLEDMIPLHFTGLFKANFDPVLKRMREAFRDWS